MKMVGQGIARKMIAEILGVKRAVVDQAILRQTSKAEDKDGRRSPIHQRGHVRRCPGCGGLVRMPCKACALNERIAKGEVFRLED